MTTPPQPMLTTQQVAKIFHLSPKTVRRKCASGEFKSHRFGREYRMTIEQVDEAKRQTLVNSPEPQHRTNTRGPRSYRHLRES